MSSPANASPSPKSIDRDLIYFNGIDIETGRYAVAPMTIDEAVESVRGGGPSHIVAKETAEAATRSFAPPYGVDLTNLAEAGWGIVFAEDASDELRQALKPLIERRRQQTNGLLKIFDYKRGEQVRDWYRRHGVSASNLIPTKVPYYLLLVGDPTAIPFEFQYLMGLEYAIGRLAFDTADEYARYATSLVGYETGASISNKKEIAFWGTQHIADPPTELSSEFLIEPLANGVPGAEGVVKTPVHVRVGYSRALFKADKATRAALLGTLHAPHPPVALFTASHGMAVPNGRPDQMSASGALLCQDWPGFGSMKPEHFLAAANVSDDANVQGLVAFLFACFSGGTPVVDQFLASLKQTGKLPPLAPNPFVAALPRRLLAHPRGSALAVIAHVDRAFTYSIRPFQMIEAQIGPFYNSLCFILSGAPIGHVVAQQFGQRYAVLSTALLEATSPTTPIESHPTDEDLVKYWMERNDAQNYVVLGDPAAHVRVECLPPAAP